MIRKCMLIGKFVPRDAKPAILQQLHNKLDRPDIINISKEARHGVDNISDSLL